MLVVLTRADRRRLSARWSPASRSSLFPRAANGSLIERDGKAVGSALIGQPFDDPKYFWGRPSATAPMPYNGGASSGSNLGPLNPALADAVKARVEALREADPDNTAAGPGRSRHRVGQRPRSAHQPGGGRVPGRARRAGARPRPRAGAGAGRAAHRAAATRVSRRAAGECAAAQSRARRDALSAASQAHRIVPCACSGNVRRVRRDCRLARRAMRCVACWCPTGYR